MPLETSDLKQKAVLWPRYPGADQFGRQRIGAPVEINSRWEFGVNLNNAPLERSENVTATVAVDRKIENGSILWKGSMDDLPDTLEDLVEVISYNEVPDVKNRERRRSVVVAAYSQSLPESA